MARNKLRPLKRKNKPYGRFDYIVHLHRKSNIAKWSATNASEFEKIRELAASFQGEHRFRFVKNHNNRRVYTHIYLSNAMDLAMLKLIFSDSIHKIYKVTVDTDEQSLDHGQNKDAA
jgi:hypothetical protein